MEKEILEALVEVAKGLKETADSIKAKDVGTTHDAVNLHGSRGLFSLPAEREVISAHVTPVGIADSLPLLPSVVEDPRFSTITGFSAVSGAEPATACESAPKGYMKSCNLTARFGMLRRDTNTIEIDKVMLRKNRGDFSDYVLYGRMLGMNSLSPNVSTADMLNVITKAEMVNTCVQVERELSRQIWQGTPAVGTQFPGLDLLVATGQKDADTGTLCPSLDSDIKDFDFSLVGGTDKDIVEYLSSMMFYLEQNASTMGLNPVNFVICMPRGLWFELSAEWPCSYLSNRCSNASGTSIAVMNDRTNVDMRDEMRNGMFIDINGKRYPVKVDDGIKELTPTDTARLKPGEFASSIYVLPLTIVGNFPVLYRQYLDYRQAAPDIALLNGKEAFWTDNGVYMWFVEQYKFCYQLGVKTEQRIVLRTPQLAGKLQNVKYTPLQHLRSPYPDSDYWKDGGVYSRTGDEYYAIWNT
ncbi:MAG: hypothetical protein HPY87_08945 [Fervidobacterium sp.]|uniref:hypothetical protein n=1 Tax=Fervidobacterium sp. TaxID=1871331 RepID=UPI0025C173DD|nr:hypothetical protein [Fervidobacterium sp.]NPU89987.1 hypothetical protein [Fervidobacterium sp.]